MIIVLFHNYQIAKMHCMKLEQSLSELINTSVYILLGE
jgi:hypothetical protein